MAQPARALKMEPEVTITFDSNGNVDKPAVTIKDGGIVEFKSNATELMEIVLVDPDGADYYALSIPVSANGKAYFIGNLQPDQDECEYFIQAVSAPRAPKKPGRVMGNNKIIIGGGGEGGGKSKRGK
jgi:hypothetical protein